MQISVIIPVYNASKFLEKAVYSAVSQYENAEVLLIEDGSSDNSLQICENLQTKYEKLKVYQHAGGQNMGAAATRNLGI